MTAAPVFNMGRRKLVGFLAVCALTLLNIWMAKFVVKPFNEAKRLQQVTAIRDPGLSDVLVVSIDDMHPLQHLEDAGAAEAKKYVPSSTTSSLRLSLTPTNDPRIADNPNFVDQTVDRNAQQFADINNNWKYENSQLTDKQLYGQSENNENRMGARSGNHENSMAIGNINTENSIAGGNVNNGNGVASNVNSWTNNNANIINMNYGNMSVPYINTNNESYLQHTNSNTHDRQPNVWTKQSGIVQAPNSYILSSHLKSVDTVELLNIKNSLETLKYLLTKFSPDSRRTVLDNLMKDEVLKAAQPSNDPGIPTSNNMEGSSPNQSLLQTGTAGNPLEFYNLGSLKSGLIPPQMAAPADSIQLDFQLLTRLLNETNTDHLNMIVRENTDAVKNLLLQILHHLQRRRRELENHQQQQRPVFIRSGQSEFGAGSTYIKSPDVSFDYNKGAIKEMIKNIATYNNVDTSSDNKVVERFLRDIQTGHL